MSEGRSKNGCSNWYLGRERRESGCVDGEESGSVCVLMVNSGRVIEREREHVRECEINDKKSMN